METFHLIKIKYISPTDFKGAKIKLHSERYNKAITIPYDYHFNGTLDIAIDYLSKNNYNIIGVAESKKCYFIITDTFIPLK